MNEWYMATLVGRDRPGIVAAVTQALYEAGCHLGETSMVRLGGNFTIMLMARCAQGGLLETLEPVADRLGLRLHLDRIEGRLHDHRIPDVRVSVHGADRAGIVAQVTGRLAEAGLDILDLDSDVAGSEAQPIYLMHIEGLATQGIEALEAALADLDAGITVHLSPIETMIG